MPIHTLFWILFNLGSSHIAGNQIDWVCAPDPGDPSPEIVYSPTPVATDTVLAMNIGLGVCESAQVADAVIHLSATSTDGGNPLFVVPPATAWITKDGSGYTLTPNDTAAEIVLYPISSSSLGAGDALQAAVNVRTVDAGHFQVHAEMTIPDLPTDTIQSQVITVEN